jgi:hypothetical protein
LPVQILRKKQKPSRRAKNVYKLTTWRFWDIWDWKVKAKKRVLMQLFKKMSRSRKFLIIQGSFGKFIDVVRGNYVCLSV